MEVQRLRASIQSDSGRSGSRHPVTARNILMGHLTNTGTWIAGDRESSLKKSISLIVRTP